MRLIFESVEDYVKRTTKPLGIMNEGRSFTSKGGYRRFVRLVNEFKLNSTKKTNKTLNLILNDILTKGGTGDPTLLSKELEDKLLTPYNLKKDEMNGLKTKFLKVLGLEGLTWEKLNKVNKDEYVTTKDGRQIKVPGNISEKSEMIVAFVILNNITNPNDFLLKYKDENAYNNCAFSLDKGIKGGDTMVNVVDYYEAINTEQSKIQKDLLGFINCGINFIKSTGISDFDNYVQVETALGSSTGFSRLAKEAAVRIKNETGITIKGDKWNVADIVLVRKGEEGIFDKILSEEPKSLTTINLKFESGVDKKNILPISVKKNAEAIMGGKDINAKELATARQRGLNVLPILKGLKDSKFHVISNLSGEELDWIEAQGKDFNYAKAAKGSGGGKILTSAKKGFTLSGKDVKFGISDMQRQIINFFLEHRKDVNGENYISRLCGLALGTEPVTSVWWVTMDSKCEFKGKETKKVLKNPTFYLSLTSNQIAIKFDSGEVVIARGVDSSTRLSVDNKSDPSSKESIDLKNYPNIRSGILGLPFDKKT